ncbi:MAG: LytTR family DNA-binding domain-containing protein [Bacteroidota bacterium]
MKKHKAVIIDDEYHNREQLTRLLDEHCESIEVAGMAAAIEDGLLLVKSIKPDVVFLDIEMPGGSGFDLLRKIDQVDFKVIFVTAYNSYALKAIKFSALDYILKPIDPEELIEAVDKLDQLRYQSESLDLLRENLKDQGSGKIALHTQDEIHFVEIGDIVRLEASANYTRLFLSDQSTLLLSKNLGFYEKLLQDSSFFRSHQSHLINLNYVAKYVKKDGGYLLMSDDQIVPVSRLKKEEIKILFRF